MNIDRFMPGESDYIIVPVRACDRHGACVQADIPVNRTALDAMTAFVFGAIAGATIVAVATAVVDAD